MRCLKFIVLLLLVIGALNWGCVGFFETDVVSMIFGGYGTASRIVFAIVGLAGLYAISFLCRCCGSCGGGSCCGSNCNCGCCKK